MCNTLMIELCMKSKRERERSRKKFFNAFYNGEKNASEIFSIKFETSIIFLFFQICLEFNGYLIIHTILISDSIATNQKPANAIALIVLYIKNNFDLCQKMEILVDFLSEKMEYSIMLQLIIFVVMLTKEFLSVYDYIHIYQLYKNMMLFDFGDSSSSDKKDVNISKIITKFSQILKQVYLVLILCMR